MDQEQTVQPQPLQQQTHITYKDQIQQYIQIPQQFQQFYWQSNFDNLDITNQQHKVSQKLKVICLLGITGQGKSATANSICNQPNSFKESPDVESCTTNTVGKYFYWQEENLSKNNKFSEEDKKTPFLVIDTPGLCDSEGRDSEHIAQMVCFLKNISYVHTFIICFNGKDPRLDENKLSILRLFSEMFGQDFYDNIIICFTKWSHGQKEKKQRKKQQQEENSMISQILGQFADKLNISIKKSQFIFIDNMYKNKDYKQICDPQELEENAQQLEIIFKKTINNKAFTCHDISVVLKDYEKLLQSIEDIEKEKLNSLQQLQQAQQQKVEIEQQQQQQQALQAQLQLQNQQRIQKQKEEQRLFEQQVEQQEKNYYQQQQQIQQEQQQCQQENRIRLNRLQQKQQQKSQEKMYQIQNKLQQLKKEKEDLMQQTNQEEEKIYEQQQQFFQQTQQQLLNKQLQQQREQEVKKQQQREQIEQLQREQQQREQQLREQQQREQQLREQQLREQQQRAQRDYEQQQRQRKKEREKERERRKKQRRRKNSSFCTIF